MIKGIVCGLMMMAGFTTLAQDAAVKNQPPSPLYRDPIYDGAADPVLVCDRDRPLVFGLQT